MLTRLLPTNQCARRLLLTAPALLTGYLAAAQAPAGPVATDQPNPLLWLLLAGLGIVGLMLIMTVGSAASAVRWAATQPEAAVETAPAVVAEAAPETPGAPAPTEPADESIPAELVLC